MRRLERQGEEGFALIVLIVAIFVILLFLGIAAPKVARDMQRERELEAIHRGNQYVRAIQLYYAKFHHYPTSVDQLEKTNNIRFLRQKYDDPLTGKPDWRIIHVGENKTTVKGLFGQPLAGLPGATGGSGIGGTSTIGAAPATGAIAGTTPSTVGGSSTSGIGSQSATTFSGGGGPIMGVGSSKTGESIVTLNEQTSYETWEFLYDPRIEQLKAKSSLFGGGIGGNAGGPGLGSGFSTPGTNPTPASPTTPTGTGATTPP